MGGEFIRETFLWERPSVRRHIELMEILLTNRRNEVGLASTLS